MLPRRGLFGSELEVRSQVTRNKYKDTLKRQSMIKQRIGQ